MTMLRDHEGKGTLVDRLYPKVFVVVWSLSGHIRVVGVYTDYNTAEEKIKEMQRNIIQGWIKIIESEVCDSK